MSDVLQKICEEKVEHIARCKALKSLDDIEAAAREVAPAIGFAAALVDKADSGLALIAEIKRASPSAGEIRPNFDPAALAMAYRDGGAACLSVLTDQPFFKGDDSYVRMAKSASGLPCLRKDFMLDPYQVVEARAIHADCILLIMAALDDGQARELYSTAREWDLDVLIEVHDGDELDRALDLGPGLLGINNRNLKTLNVDLATTEDLAPRVPAEWDIVCESGLKQHEDLVRMTHCGARRFLVGEHLMRQDDVAAATSKLLGTSVANRESA
ncbi:MAG: indole-3-glycerol phosphate synthase TrpC [Pseudomonadota bacterium]